MGTNKPATIYGDFSDESLVLKMEKLLTEARYLDSSLIGTKSDKLLYIGVEWCNDERQNGWVLTGNETVKVQGGTIFTTRAKKAVGKHGGSDLKKLMLDIENFKSLPWFITTKDHIKGTNNSTKALEIFKVQARFDRQTGRLPILVYTKEEGYKSDGAQLYKLTEYGDRWIKSSVLNPTSDIEFSSSNFIKTPVYHFDKKVLIIDNYGVYLGKDEEGAELEMLCLTENLPNFCRNKGLKGSIAKRVTEVQAPTIVAHQAWILPYLCGETKDIYLNTRGFVINKNNSTEKEKENGAKES